MSLRELGRVSLEDALAYLDLLAEQKPEKLERAAVRWYVGCGRRSFRGRSKEVQVAPRCRAKRSDAPRRRGSRRRWRNLRRRARVLHRTLSVA